MTRSEHMTDSGPGPRRRSRRVRVGMVLAVLFMAIIGSAGLVFVVDYVVFLWGTWDPWRMSFATPRDEDLAWWRANVGPLPPETMGGALTAPTVPSRPRGAGANGAPGAPGIRLPHGVGVYRMDTGWPMIDGGVLVSPTVHAWRAGVNLPGGMVVERRCVVGPGLTPPHPSSGGWRMRVLPTGLALNTLYAAGPVCVVVMTLIWGYGAAFRRIRGRIRRVRGQCPGCGYMEGPSPGDTCPECGCAWR